LNWHSRSYFDRCHAPHEEALTINKNMKIIISIIAAIAVGTLAGCSPNPNNSGSSDNGSATMTNNPVATNSPATTNSTP
jgi:hypothetical protein